MAKNWNETIQEMHKHEALEKAAAVLSPLDEARALIEQMRDEMKMNARAAEMQANIMRDKKRTKAYGQVHEMCLRVANAFDVHAFKLRRQVTAAEAWLKAIP